MTTWLTKSTACAIALLAASVGHAQTSDWEYEASIYLFMPETVTSITTPTFSAEGTLSFSDALSNLDMAFMGSFGASNGRWGVLGDFMYTDISFGNPTPGGLTTDLNTALTTQIFNGYLTYRAYEAPTVQLDVAGGFRWFSTKTALTLTPGLLPGSSATVEESWVDPVIGARVRFDIADNWSGTAFFDYGGFSSDSETWQTLLTIDYALNDRWLLRGGYRYISVDHDINGTDFKFSQSGPIFGATYRF